MVTAAEVSARDFIMNLAPSLNKSEDQMETFVLKLESESVIKASQLCSVTDEQLREDMKFPLGLVKAIRVTYKYSNSTPEQKDKVK